MGTFKGLAKPVWHLNAPVDRLEVPDDALSYQINGCLDHSSISMNNVNIITKIMAIKAIKLATCMHHLVAIYRYIMDDVRHQDTSYFIWYWYKQFSYQCNQIIVNPTVKHCNHFGRHHQHYAMCAQ